MKLLKFISTALLSSLLLTASFARTSADKPGAKPQATIATIRRWMKS